MLKPDVPWERIEFDTGSMNEGMIVKKRSYEGEPLKLTCPLWRLRVPDGSPPVALTGKVTDESIRQWAMKTREAWQVRHYFLTNYGLVVTLKRFIDEDEHPRAWAKAVAIINALPDA